MKKPCLSAKDFIKHFKGSLLIGTLTLVTAFVVGSAISITEVVMPIILDNVFLFLSVNVFNPSDLKYSPIGNPTIPVPFIYFKNDKCTCK